MTYTPTKTAKSWVILNTGTPINGAQLYTEAAANKLTEILTRLFG